jgi:hypothetical protein
LSHRMDDRSASSILEEWCVAGLTGAIVGGLVGAVGGWGASTVSTSNELYMAPGFLIPVCVVAGACVGGATNAARAWRANTVRDERNLKELEMLGYIPPRRG